MLRLISATRALMALVAGLSSLGCGDDEEKEPPVTDPGPSTGSTCPSDQTLTYENFGREFLANYCTHCHSSELTGSDRHGAPLAYNWDQIETVREHADLIDKMAAAGPDAVNTSMPIGTGTPRPDVAEREQLGEWLECGAP